MALTTHKSLLHHRPQTRPFLLTRSTSPSTSKYTSHWLGDNISSHPSLRQSLTSLLQFAALHSHPHIGADVCGFLSHATPALCARWATTAALTYPFYRNHAVDSSSPQEFYRWPVVAEAARRAGGLRYRLLDYIYTGLEGQSRTGSASTVLPLWFLHPGDVHAAGVVEQLYLGDALMVSPVVHEGRTHVDVYFPAGVTFYRFDLETHNFTRVLGAGETRPVRDLDLPVPPPLHIRAGCIVPVRAKVPFKEPNAGTTGELRQRNFEVYVAPGADGGASGTLYVDDGVSVDVGVQASSLVEFEWTESSTFSIHGRMNYKPSPSRNESILIQYVHILGVSERPQRVVGTYPALGFREENATERGTVRRDLEIDFDPVSGVLMVWFLADMYVESCGGGAGGVCGFEVEW